MPPDAGSPNPRLDDDCSSSHDNRWGLNPSAAFYSWTPNFKVDANAGVAGVYLEEAAASESESEGGGVSDAVSIAGDSVESSSCEPERETRIARKQPTVPFEGECRRGGSSHLNSAPEVGNCGFFFGNLGLNGSTCTSEPHHHQIMRNPAQVIILCETTAAVETMLRNPAVAAEKPGEKGLAGRNTYEHFVVRGNEEPAAVLIAARKDNCSSLELIEYDPHYDHGYWSSSTSSQTLRTYKRATTRTLTCRVGFKQNVGYLGTEIIVCGVHGNALTMKVTWPTVLETFWDRLASKITRFGVQILAGDFNMSLTNVIPELRSRGIRYDCLAWYPWVHKTARCQNQPLGMDSCAIFYIGGNVQSKMQWGLKDLERLTAVADTKAMRWTDYFHEYEGDCIPGKPWGCYRSFHSDEPRDPKDLRARLTDLLTPSTSQRDLNAIPGRTPTLCPYLRFKQKPMNIDEWLVDGNVQMGAHFPLCCFTNNCRARSAVKATERLVKVATWQAAQRAAERCAWSAKKRKKQFGNQQSWREYTGKRSAEVAEQQCQAAPSQRRWQMEQSTLFAPKSRSSNGGYLSAEVAEQQLQAAPSQWRGRGRNHSRSRSRGKGRRNRVAACHHSRFVIL